MGRTARQRGAPWLAGAVLALLVLGPALAPGSLLNLGLVLVGCGLVADRGHRAVKVVAVFVVAQLPWLIPGIFTVGSSGPLSNPRHFATHASVPFGVLRVVAGGGFWRVPSQVGATGIGAAVLGGALLVLAFMGARRLPAEWRAPAGGRP